MIVALEGKLEYKEPKYIHINVNGVVYEVFISLQTFASIESTNIKLSTVHIIREDAQLLYGFLELAEKKLFQRLIKINGIGPKVAMAICSTYTPSQFGIIIESKNIDGIKKVPGIGPKSAGRIIVELNGFDADLLIESSPRNRSFSEATEALEALGFKKDKISKALSSCKGDDTAQLVKQALKLLQTL